MNRLLAGIIATLCAAPVAAQTLDPDVFPIDMVTPTLNGILLENAISEPARSGRAQPPAPRRPEPSPARAAGHAAPTVVTTYRRSPAVSERVKRDFVDFIRKTDGPVAAQAVERVLAGRDFVQSWSQTVAEEGLRAGDLSDALAAYWMLNYLIANGLDDGPKRSGAAVSRQVRDVVARNQTLARLSEPQRQSLAEILMLNFLAQVAAYDGAVRSNDADLKRRLGDAAVARFRNEMGLDLRQIELTTAGFVDRRRPQP